LRLGKQTIASEHPLPSPLLPTSRSGIVVKKLIEVTVVAVMVVVVLILARVGMVVVTM